jgi:hypothetical protein
MYEINMEYKNVHIYGEYDHEVVLSFDEIEKLCHKMKEIKKSCTATSKAGCKEDCDNELCSIHIFKNKPIIE